jgi:hypothetical protein
VSKGARDDYRDERHSHRLLFDEAGNSYVTERFLSHEASTSEHRNVQQQVKLTTV